MWSKYTEPQLLVITFSAPPVVKACALSNLIFIGGLTIDEGGGAPGSGQRGRG
jgi:hypothetical protein